MLLVLFHFIFIFSFSQAFKNANKAWTTALCQADSDGDGKTNGEELGDKDCKWTEAAPGPLDAPIGHPGI